MNLTKENPEPYPLNTNPAIQDCASRRCGENWCRFSESVKGWGCRFLLIVPNRLPATKKERGMLFSNAHAHAEKSGSVNSYLHISEHLLIFVVVVVIRMQR